MPLQPDVAIEHRLRSRPHRRLVGQPFLKALEAMEHYRRVA